MSDHLGIGVMLHLLAGNRESVEAFQKAQGQKIAALHLDEGGDEGLHFVFENGYKMKLFDDGQSCCESRYMRTDDDLEYYIGATLLDAETKDAPSITGEYGDHDVQFLVVTTDRGAFTMSSHNEHNGYYAGFVIIAKEE